MAGPLSNASLVSLRLGLTVALFATLLTTWPYKAFAQVIDGPGTLHLGPLVVRPRATAMLFGFDSNVFNDAIDPKSDRAQALVLAVDMSLRLGRGTFTGSTSLSYTHYATYANQGATNASQDGRFEFPLNRVMLRASFSVASVRDRPGLDIDLRVRRFLSSRAVGADVRLFPKTVLRIGSLQATTKFRDGVVQNISLPAALDGTSYATSLSIRHEMSALTTVTLSGDWLRDRFKNTPTRNASGFRVAPGFEFTKFALISGTAAVGYRSFQPGSPDIPPFRGVVAGVNLASVIRGSIRLSGGIDRDVTYSYSPDQPYFLQTSTRMSVVYRIGTRWETTASVGVQRLSYRTAAHAVRPAPVDVTAAAPKDLGVFYGLGAGYYLRPGLRLIFDGRHSNRTSAVAGRDYIGWQVGSSVVYGF